MSFEWYPDKPYPEFSHIKSISSQLDTQPTILVAEALFITSSLLCLLHASQTSKDLVVTWFAAIISGTANDVFFMVLPMVDNFWHAQCTIMLTPRLPLYIPLGERGDEQRAVRSTQYTASAKKTDIKYYIAARNDLLTTSLLKPSLRSLSFTSPSLRQLSVCWRRVLSAFDGG